MVLLTMLSIAAVLTTITIIVHAVSPAGFRDPFSSYVDLLALPDATSEHSIANWYSSLAMVGCAGLMALIGLGRRRRGEPGGILWLGLALLAALLALDEGIALHDALSTPLRDALDLGGFLYMGWVVVWIPVALLLAWVYAPFILGLRRGPGAPVVAAIALFLFCAAALEFVEGHLYDNSGTAFPYMPLSIAEELGEMTALALLAYGLLRLLLRGDEGSLRIAVGAEPAGLPVPTPRRRAARPAETRRRSSPRSASR